MPASRIITCAMRDSNGVYNGPWDLGEDDPIYEGDYVFQGPCSFTVNGNIKCKGKLKGMNGADVTVNGDVEAYTAEFESPCTLSVQGMAIYTVNP